MKVLVNGNTLNVANAYAERDTVTGIITCTVVVPNSEIGHAELKAMFKNNAGDIIKTDGESSETFSGFKFSAIIDDDANEQYIVKLTADEYSFQLGRNRQLEADKAQLESTVANKEDEISNLNGTVAEKNNVIAEREATIEAKDNVIAEKEETIVAKDVVIAEKETVIGEKEVVITEQAETITVLEATIATKEEELSAKNLEIAELLTIAEEYADMVFASLEEEIGEEVVEESEVM